MKATLFLVLCVLASASAFPSYSLGSLTSSLEDHVQDEAPEELPAGYMSWVISPTTVRAAIFAAVSSSGIPPPVSTYIANAAANRAIKAMHLEATIVTTTPKPGYIGSMVNAASGQVTQSSAMVASKAAELAVSTALNQVVGQTIGNYVARTIGNQVFKSLGGKVEKEAEKDADEENHKQTWAEYIRSKAG